jgi:hypothetical protein
MILAASLSYWLSRALLSTAALGFAAGLVGAFMGNVRVGLIGVATLMLSFGSLIIENLLRVPSESISYVQPTLGSLFILLGIVSSIAASKARPTKPESVLFRSYPSASSNPIPSLGIAAAASPESGNELACRRHLRWAQCWLFVVVVGSYIGTAWLSHHGYLDGLPHWVENLITPFVVIISLGVVFLVFTPCCRCCLRGRMKVRFDEQALVYRCHHCLAEVRVRGPRTRR